MEWSGVSNFLYGFECKRNWTRWNTNQELFYNLSWRQLHSVERDVPWRIRKDAGHSLKSCIGYSISIDKRNDSLLPTNGVFGKLNFEFAGLGGDVKHFKTEFDGQFIKTIFKKLVILNLFTNCYRICLVVSRLEFVYL